MLKKAFPIWSGFTNSGILDKSFLLSKSLVVTSTCKDLSEAMISYGSPQRFIKEDMMDQLRNIDKKVWDSRGFSDCFGYSLVFDGSIDLFIEVDLRLPKKISWKNLCSDNISVKF